MHYGDSPSLAFTPSWLWFYADAHEDEQAAADDHPGGQVHEPDAENDQHKADRK